MIVMNEVYILRLPWVIIVQRIILFAWKHDSIGNCMNVISETPRLVISKKSVFYFGKVITFSGVIQVTFPIPYCTFTYFPLLHGLS